MGTTGSPGERLRTFRTSLNLTGSALAKALGRSKGSISYWEAGRSPLPLSACLGLESAFGVSAKWLMAGDEPMWAQTDRKKLPESSPGLIVLPVLSARASFDDAGSPISAPPVTEEIGIPASLLESDPQSAGIAQSSPRIWIRVVDPLMMETLGNHAFVLIDTTGLCRNEIINHALYLVRLAPDDIPSVRRIAMEPHSGDLIVGTDGRDHVSLRLPYPAEGRLEIVLGRVIWILRKPA